MRFHALRPSSLRARRGARVGAGASAHEASSARSRGVHVDFLQQYVRIAIRQQVGRGRRACDKARQVPEHDGAPGELRLAHPEV